MPRLITDTEKKNRITVSIIQSYLTERGLNWLDLARLCGFSENTARNRRKNPEGFTVKELRRLKGLSESDISSIVLGKK